MVLKLWHLRGLFAVANCCMTPVFHTTADERALVMWAAAATNPIDDLDKLSIRWSAEDDPLWIDGQNRVNDIYAIVEGDGRCHLEKFVKVKK